MLEEMEFAEQEPVEEDHVVEFIDRKDRDKAEEEAEKGIVVSEAVPYRDDPGPQYDQHADRHQYPADRSCAVKQLFVSCL